jgi:CheY-like chemotaxis protein
MALAGDMSVQNVRRLKALHVLVAGSDRPFVRVTAFLLARRGYAVSEAGPGDAIRTADRCRADVVVLECGTSRAVAGRVIAQLAALPGSPAVVLVTESREEPWGGRRTVEKWSSVELLVAGIEAAALERPAPLAEASST